MVNHKNKILDCGKYKFVPECIEMKKPEYVYKFESEMANMTCCYQRYKSAGASYQDAVNRRLSTVSYWEAEYPRVCGEWSEFENNKFLMEFLFMETVPNSKSEYDRIAKYYNIIPFTPSVMINISPDWNGSGIDKKTNTSKIGILKCIINNYMKEGWYDSWSYVIENGSTGTHIHAHIVAHMNPQRLKSCESHLRKGNHSNQLKKYGNKYKGMEGMIKGTSIQKVFLRSEELVKDKLLYLQEDFKPEGHKNKSVIKDGFVKGEL